MRTNRLMEFGWRVYGKLMRIEDNKKYLFVS